MIKALFLEFILSSEGIKNRGRIRIYEIWARAEE